MNVLGLSFGYHDSSVCLVRDGAIVFASTEDKFTRQKHDAGFPRFALEHCWERTGLRPQDIDAVVFHEDPHTKFSRVLVSALSGFPFSRREFTQSMQGWIGKKLWSLQAIVSETAIPANRIHYLGHHFSHATQAFMGSGFSEAAILVVDAVGDWASTAIYRGHWDGAKPQIERVEEIAFPNSLGLVYSAVTAFLGFNPNDSECSTMALAAFGDLSYKQEFEKIIRAEADGRYTIDQTYFNFSNFYRGPVTKKFLRTFGTPRSSNQPLAFASFGNPERMPTADEQRWANIAASLQAVIEERILALAQRAKAKTGVENLCLAGGVAMNCVAMGKVLRANIFAKTYMPPDPGDGGTSIGSALYYSGVNNKTTLDSMSYSPYLGCHQDEAEDVAMLEHLNYATLSEYKQPGCRADTKPWRTTSFRGNQEGLLQAAVKLLAEGKIVGWYQGNQEIGPRALGHRSILIRPDSLGTATRLSERVKSRARFRPYAISLTRSSAEQCLAVEAKNLDALRWMQYSAPVRPEFHEALRAAMHVDGSTRPQVVSAKEAPLFHALLTAYGRVSGQAALLNTSFNQSGYPMVATPTEALLMFARTDMDALVLNNTLIVRGEAEDE